MDEILRSLVTHQYGIGSDMVPRVERQSLKYFSIIGILIELELDDERRVITSKYVNDGCVVGTDTTHLFLLK